MKDKLDLHYLRVFQAAARTSSFTAAGRELSLSQSTVSLHIQQLESDLGCLLFVRFRRRVALSDAGRILLPYVERTLAELKNAELAMQEYSTSQRGTIRLGVGASTLIYLLPDVLAEYRKRQPKIEVIVTTAITEELLQSLLNHNLDLAIVMSPSAALDLVSAVPFMVEELVFALSREHPLANKPTLAPEDLDGVSFISHLRGTAMQTVQNRYFEKLGVQPRVVMEMENLEAIKSLIRANMGVSLLPLCSISATGNGIAYKRVRNIKMSRDLLLAASNWRAHPPATRQMAKQILQTLGNVNSEQAFTMLDQLYRTS